MRDPLRVTSPLFAMCVVAGCNALFDVEEPVIVEVGVDGGAAGEGGSRVVDGGDGAAGESLGRAGASGDPGGTEGGSAGQAVVGGAGREGGAGGIAEPPATTGGSMDQGAGGASGTGGRFGTGGDVSGSGGAWLAAGAAGALGAAGSAGCAEGSSRCLNDDQLEVCDQGALRREGCPLGCVNDECAECEAGTVECGPGNTSARECGADGQFPSFTPCVNRTCVPEVGCDGVCAPGQVRCNPMNGNAETCTAGSWTLANECVSQTQRCVIEDGEAICIPNDVYPLGPEAPLSGGAVSSQTPNFLQLFPLPAVEETAVVAEMGLIGDGMPAYAQMVLYEDDGSGYPGARLTFTSTIDVEGPGPNTKQPTSVVHLDPEKAYWIGVVFAPDGSPQLRCRERPEAPQSYERSLNFNAAFPNPLPAGAQPIFERECNLFLRVRTLTP